MTNIFETSGKPPQGLGAPNLPDFDEMGGWPVVLGRMVSKGSLSVGESESVMRQILNGNATPVQIAALLLGLRAKGETVDEMTGMTRAMLTNAEPLTVKGDCIDVVGTGGDRLRSINVSTIAALITAGAGVPVCKHGNRAATSSVGTADVLEQLGVVIDLGPTGVAKCIDGAGMGFCFAPRFHPAMRFAGPVRKELGIPTIFNFLGPLANPARVRRQLVGVSDPKMASNMAGVLAANFCAHAMVVYADDGLDEISTTSRTTVIEISRSGSDAGGKPELRTWRLNPQTYGIPMTTMDHLRGGDAAFNADVIRRVLGGEKSPARDIGVLNAGAALVIAGAATDMYEGVIKAQNSLDEGSAAGVLEALVRISTFAAHAEVQAGERTMGSA